MLRSVAVITRQQSWLGRGARRGCSAYACLNSVMPCIPACYWSMLPNGFRVISEQSTGELACVALFCEAGARYESPRNNGVAHLFEHMAFKGFNTHRRVPLELCVVELGAKISIHTDREYQVFTAVCPNSSVDPIAHIFAKLFVDLQIDYVEMDYAKCMIAKELEEEEKDPKALTFYYLHKAAFQGTSLAQAPIGRLANYYTMDTCYLKNYIAHHYQPFRMVLSVSSKYNHNEVVAIASKQFGPFQQTSDAAVHMNCRFTGSEARWRNDDMPYAYAALAVETVGYSSSDYLTMEVMKHVIGRWDVTQSQGYSTWPLLAQACEVSKLAAHYETFYIPYRDVGLFGVYLVMPKEVDMEDALLMVQETWMQLCTATHQSDVDRARRSLKLEYAKKVDGCVESCHDMGLQMIYYGNRRNLVEIYGAIDRVFSNTIMKKANEFIYDREYAMGAIGPVESLLAYNRTRAGMYWLRL